MQSLKNIGTEYPFDVQQPKRNPVKHFPIFSVSKEGLEPSRACAHLDYFIIYFLWARRDSNSHEQRSYASETYAYTSSATCP